MSNHHDPLPRTVRRIGLLATAMILFRAGLDAWHMGRSADHPISLGLSFLAWILAVSLAVLSLSSSNSRRTEWLIFCGLIFSFLIGWYVRGFEDAPLLNLRTDNEMIARYAVQVLKRGYNPYDWDYTDIRRVFRDKLSVTFFLDGSIQHRVTYPALPTLLLFVLDLIGLGDPNLVNGLATLGIFATLFLASQSHLRPVVLLPLFLLYEMLHLPLHGGQDALWSALLVGVVLTWNRPVAPAVLFGLACSYRQQPWLVAPFLLIGTWHEANTVAERVERTGRFVAIAGSIFLLINGPFIVWNPEAWVLSAFEPSYATFDVVSQGLGTMTQFGLSELPRRFFTILQLSFLTGAIVLHARHPRLVDRAFWVFPAIFFWLYYRALSSYLIFWLPPLLAALSRPQAVDRALSPRRGRNSWKLTAALLGTLAAGPLLSGIALTATKPADISVTVVPPLRTMPLRAGVPYVRQVMVEVTNHTATTVEPRFSVQHVRPYPWLILSGPELLKPGETARYLIDSLNFGRAYPAGDGAQLVVTDAKRYGIREVVALAPEKSFYTPDMIVNGAFRFWSIFGHSPAGWHIDISPNDQDTVTIRQIEDRHALSLERSKSGYVRLTQMIPFPEEVRLWVYPVTAVDEPQNYAYGLEFDDGEHRLWILFGGDQRRQSRMADGTPYLILPAPLNQWSLQDINLAEHYREAGWRLPPYTKQNRGDTGFYGRQVKLSLLLDTKDGTHRQAIFGPFQQTQPPRGTTPSVEHALEDPASYYVCLGDEYQRQRNHQLAIEAYRTALTYTSDTPEAQVGLLRSWIHLGRCDLAATYLDQVPTDHPEYRAARQDLADCQPDRLTEWEKGVGSSRDDAPSRRAHP